MAHRTRCLVPLVTLLLSGCSYFFPPPPPTPTPEPKRVVFTTTPTPTAQRTLTPTTTPTPNRVRYLNSASTSAEGRVTMDRLRVRKGPGLEYAIVGQLMQDEMVEVIGLDATGDWLEIRVPQAGWVSQAYIDFTSEPESIRNLPVSTPRPTNTVKAPTPLPRPVQPVQPVAPAVAPRVEFFASPTRIVQGACANLTWHVDGVREVYLSGSGVEGHGSMEVCPAQTTAYQLHVVYSDGTFKDIWLTVGVTAAPTAANPSINIVIVWPTPAVTQTPWVVTATPTRTPTSTPTATATATATATPP